MSMHRRCAWCGADIGDVEGPADETTHGMCERCAALSDDQRDALAVRVQQLPRMDDRSVSDG